MSDKTQNILVVDDEEDICEILQFNLEGEGYNVKSLHSAEEVLKIDLSSFDLILLDVMMEEVSGFKLAKIIRNEMKNNIPIIFITAKNTENDLLTAFNLGGDDFIRKPFSIKEVIVRVKAALSRVKTNKSSDIIDKVSFETLTLSYNKRNLTVDGEEIDLTKKEFEILALLVKTPGRVFSREEIMDRVWEDDTYVTSRTIDVHITRLRKKTGDYGKYIHSKSGFGYSFHP